MFREGMDISILISGAVAHSAVFTRMIHGSVSRTTDKAIQVELRDRKGTATIWLPKKAVQVHGSSFRLANWFRPDGSFMLTVQPSNGAGHGGQNVTEVLTGRYETREGRVNLASWLVANGNQRI